MRDVVKEPLDVGIEYMGVPLLTEFQHPRHRPMTVACRPEPIGVVVEDPLEERTQELPEHFLSNAVADSGDTQGPGFAVAFGDMDPTQGEGPERPIL